MTIRNPVEWTVDQFRGAGQSLGETSRGFRQAQQDLPLHVPTIRRIELADLRDIIRRGYEDFGENRTDVAMLCVFYPVVGLLLGRIASGYGLLPMLFPLASGFALIGPFAALGLYEISRRREQGEETSWANAFSVLQAPTLGSILLLGGMLVAIFLLWLAVAQGLYMITLGPDEPVSAGAFFHDVFTTRRGFGMIVAGIGIGFLFAVLVLGISVIAFPMLLDREVGLETAVRTSVSAVLTNPVPMAAWGLIVAASLLLGSIPLFLGLVIVLPVLGHATWHLYRAVVH